MQAETGLFIHGGTYDIVSGGGCLPEYRQALEEPVRKGDAAPTEQPAVQDAPSCKGMKAAYILIDAGEITVSSRDDAVHADGNIAVYGGFLELSSNDDGIHADDTFMLTGGGIHLSDSYEGIEAAHILLLGGTTDVTAIDNGWNAASKKISEEESGKRRKSRPFDITVSGGEHYVLSGGDAIDSNGSILISGGATFASSSNAMKEAPIDYPEVCECQITDGVLVASGGYGKNTQNFNLAPNQASVLLKWREEQEAGEPVQLSVDDEELLTLAPKAAYKSMIVSAPSLQVGRKLTVRQGGSVCQREIIESILLFPVSPRQAKRSPAEVGRLVASMQGMVARVMNESAMTAFPTQDASTKLGYWLYTPENAGDEELPLIVYLHGGSGKGDDLSLITAADGFPKYLQEGALQDVRAYVLIPQCPANAKGWQDVSRLFFSLMDAISAQYPVDGDRVILTGHSMGGTGTWALAALAPERFSCIAPMSGSVTMDAQKLQALSRMAVWAFVGEGDRVVKPEFSVEAVNALAQNGAEARLTIFPGAEHRDVPALAWPDEDLNLLDWMLAQ